jgi:FAD/FMN-containing dehydrogenase
MNVNRRHLLIASAAAATGVGGNRATSEENLRLKFPSVGRSFRFDEAARKAVADDLGHIVRHMPEGVLQPSTDIDLLETIRWARDNKRKVAARGQGHSVYGRSQARDGIVVDMRPLRQIYAVTDDRVVVGSGATWREVLAATLPRKLTPPVLTGYLDLSVGGTLAVGGVGDTSFRQGFQSDNVVEMDVVTGSGHQLACSARNNPDLFDAVRAGLGQVGIITRAALRLVPAPETVRLYELKYPDLQSMLADQRRLVSDSRFQALQGAIAHTNGGWTYRIDAAVFETAESAPADDRRGLDGLAADPGSAKMRTLPYFDYLDRLALLERLLRSKGRWSHPHPWLTTFVGETRIERVAREELAHLAPSDLGEFGQVLLSPLRRSANTSPFLQLPPEESIYAFNLVRLPNTDDATEAHRLTTANRAAYDRIRAVGGVLYPVSAFAMSSGNWQAHFGAAWPRMLQAKAEFDPDHLLTPGCELFPS